MKKTIVIIAVSSISLLFMSSMATANDCQNKQTEIEKKIASLKEDKQTDDLPDLEALLAKLKQNCSLDDLITETKDNIGKIQNKQIAVLNERSKIEKELVQALDANNDDKINQYEQALLAKDGELQELKIELEQAEKELEWLTIH